MSVAFFIIAYFIHIFEKISIFFPDRFTFLFRLLKTRILLYTDRYEIVFLLVK